MTAPLPLPIYPYPMTAEQSTVVHEAYLRLGPGAPSVQPVPANPGEPTRVLGLAAFPPFVCDLAYVPDPTNVDQIENRLRWLLLDEGDAGFMVLDYLKAIFGPEVREVPNG